jgi:type I restriction enzyme S subunit
MRDGWKAVTLGDICRIVTDRREARLLDGVPYVGMEHMPSDAPSVRKSGSTVGLASQVVLFRRDDVLFGRLRPYLRKVALADFSGVCSPEILVLRPSRQHVEPAYLYALASSDRVIDLAVSASAGTRMPRTSGADLLAFPVWLPPFAEQRRIVDVIEAVDATVVATSASADYADRLRAAIVEDLIFEPDHEWRTLAEIATERGLAGGPFGSSLTTDFFVDTGVPVIQGTNLTGADPFLRHPFKYVSPEKAASLRNNLAGPGDVIVTQRGTLGQVALVPPDGPRTYVISQSQMRLRPDPARARGEYVYLALSSPRLVSEIISQKIATANPHINLGIFGRLRIPVPPLDVQARVVDLAFSAIAVRRAASRTTKTTRRLRAALLSDLMSGDHEIPPSYDRFLDAAA